MAAPEIRKLEKRLRDLLPSASIEVSPPAGEDGYWFVDVAWGENAVTVRWCKGEPFGVASRDRNSYGGGPDETYQNAEDVASRIQEILLSGGRTTKPAEVTLRELRAERDLSQVELARLLGIAQPAVSRQEGRVKHMRLDTLSAIAAAMGGRLVVQICFTDGTAHRLKIDEEENAVSLKG